jgi:hypothetical protein
MYIEFFVESIHVTSSDDLSATPEKMDVPYSPLFSPMVYLKF